jgi:gliding motility-associated-like protein
MKKNYLSLLFVLAVIPSFAQVKGVIQVKIQPEFEQQLERTVRALQTSAAPVPLRVGIRRFDAVNARFNATSMRRIFPDAGEYEALHRQAGLHLWYEIYFDANADVEEAVAAYSKTGEIEQAGKVHPIKRITGVTPNPATTPPSEEATPVARSTTVTDPLFKKQWNYHNSGQIGATTGVDINLPEAWDYTMGSAEVIVAVVDGGIDVNHPDLKNALWSGIGKNFVTESSPITPDDHGTHVAGTIGALTNNNTGVSGIAGGVGNGNGVRLMSCQIFEEDGGRGNIHQAIVYAADNGAVICQNSWGYEKAGEYNPSDSVAIRYFIDHAGKNPDGSPRPGTKMNGGIAIFAAGNDGENKKWYPAGFDFVTAVAAVGYNGKKAWYSNYGDWVDIAAPGGDSNTGGRHSGTILSTLPTKSSHMDKERTGYGWMEGTSMACPHVSGVAALILSKYGSATYTPGMLRARLIDSTSSLEAFDPTYAKFMGKGLLNAGKALSGAEIRAYNVKINDCLTEEIPAGATWTLSATVLPDAAINKNVTFSSDNPAVVEISGQTATGKAVGEANITVTTEDGGLTDVCRAKIVIPVTGVTLEPRIVKLQQGDTVRFRAIIEPDSATNKNTTWRSDNPAVVQVENSGLITVLSGGSLHNPEKAMIKVTTHNGSYTATADVYTYNAVYAPEGFSPNGDGVNDHFTFALDPHKRYTLSIFDRSGQAHFQSDDYRNDWDGTANTGPWSGSKLPANTYLYTLSTKSSGQVKKGFVVIKY